MGGCAGYREPPAQDARRRIVSFFDTRLWWTGKSTGPDACDVLAGLLRVATTHRR